MVAGTPLHRSCSTRGPWGVAAAIIISLLLSRCAGRGGGDDAPGDPWLFLDGDLTALSRQSEGKELLFSSFDRTGGNDDGFAGTFSALRRDDRGEFVLAETDGPGVVRRIWLTWPGRSSNLRIYIDGADEPALDASLEELFSGKLPPFIDPFVGGSKRFGGVCFSYIPIPFRESVRITATEGLRFYQINVERLAGAGRMKSFSFPAASAVERRLAAARAALAALPARPSMNAPWTVPGAASMEVHRSEATIDASGDEVVLFESDAPGSVAELRLCVADPARTLREWTLAASWDGEEKPSVLVPLADLFGSAFLPATVRSCAIIAAGGCGILRFPMPFDRARITLRGPVGGKCDAALLVDRTAPRTGLRFHALWKEQRSEKGKRVALLSTRGRGFYAGTMLSVIAAGKEGFLEGDERVVVDGDEKHALSGTGTEDYFNSGWYFAKAGEPRPFHGASFVDRENAPRFSAFRFHIPDRIPFRSSIEFSFEHGDRNSEEGCIYASVALWYQEGEGAPTSAIPDGLSFLPGRPLYPAYIRPLKTEAPSDSFQYKSIARWSDFSTAWIDPPGAADSLPLLALLDGSSRPVRATADVPVSGTYDVRLVFARAPTFGEVDVSFEGTSLVRRLRCDADRLEPVNLSDPVRLLLKAGELELLLDASAPVRPVLKGEERVIALLDGLLLDPAGPFLTRWRVVGPFENRYDLGFEKAFPPEKECRAGGVVPAGPYTGLGGRPVRWIEAKADTSGYVDLRSLLGGGAHRVAYAATRAVAPAAREVLFSMGGDDGLAVWVNGREVWRNHVHRGYAADDDRFVADVEKGENEIVVKVDQYIAGWGFSLRVNDPGGVAALRNLSD